MRLLRNTCSISQAGDYDLLLSFFSINRQILILQLIVPFASNIENCEIDDGDDGGDDNEYNENLAISTINNIKDFIIVIGGKAINDNTKCYTMQISSTGVP